MLFECKLGSNCGDKSLKVPLKALETVIDLVKVQLHFLGIMVV